MGKQSRGKRWHGHAPTSPTGEPRSFVVVQASFLPSTLATIDREADVRKVPRTIVLREIVERWEKESFHG